MSEKSFAVKGSIEINGVNIDLEGTQVGSSLHRIGNQFTPSQETPIGTVVMYTGLINGTKTNLPSGWLLCDGTETSVSSYPELDSVVGTRYGDRTNGSGGAGTSHFRLPNLVDKLPVGHIRTNIDAPNSISASTDNTTLTPNTANSSGNHNHSSNHGSNSVDGFTNHTHGSNAGNSSHGHNVTSEDKPEGTNHNLGSADGHTHAYKTGQASAQMNFLSANHNHTSSTVNAGHSHTGGNANNGNHQHNSNSADLNHKHTITVSTSDASQGINDANHQHPTGFNTVKVFFIIKAKNEVI